MKSGNAVSDVLFITASDDQNPQTFLYYTTVNVEDFLKLRREQNLHVEFSDFADKVTELFELIRES